MDSRKGGGSVRTSCNPQHSHDADDGGVDGQGSVDLDLLQSDAHDGQQHDGQIQLVPPKHKHIVSPTPTNTPKASFQLKLGRGSRSHCQ